MGPVVTVLGGLLRVAMIMPKSLGKRPYHLGALQNMEEATGCGLNQPEVQPGPEGLPIANTEAAIGRQRTATVTHTFASCFLEGE